jgi:hypothetical protein
LSERGLFNAYWQIRKVQPTASFNLVYAMQGALLNVAWHQLPQALKHQLVHDWETYLQNAAISQ